MGISIGAKFLLGFLFLILVFTLFPDSATKLFIMLFEGSSQVLG